MSRLTRLFAAAFLGLVSIAGVANAQSIGINFASQEIDPTQAVTGTAGVVPQGNWNNLRNGSGPAPDPAPDLIDNTGAATGATATWGSSGTFRVNGSSAIPSPGDEQMMNSALFGNDARNFTINGTVTNIPYARYDVYIYLGSDSNGRLGETTVNGVTLYSTSINDAPQLDGDGSFTYFAITSTNPLARDAGNYAYFPGLTASSFDWSTANTDFTNSSLTGIQIVASNVVPEPGTAGLLAIGSCFALIRRRRTA